MLAIAQAPDLIKHKKQKSKLNFLKVSSEFDFDNYNSKVEMLSHQDKILEIEIHDFIKLMNKNRKQLQLVINEKSEIYSLITSPPAYPLIKSHGDEVVAFKPQTYKIVYSILFLCGLIPLGLSTISLYVTEFINENITKVLMPMSGIYLLMIAVDFALRRNDHN
ncbi:hypothetical protein COLU111180_13705 [Cohnella lubricantis]|uniref:Uncharacterized protein n=1 Tax=Cohnella lubricantis TaxID=2163172 RepID=A0A841TCD3_9BACL|nr:hypothetical protein [Cohnella lubricantis]MBB6677806.1 hypothetical protein [Cohnella lubricantis]MBP2120477.1 hypothetical protein [Cohnella lubricantis]